MTVSDRIGFYSLQLTLDQRGYIGAILVTDDLGKPEEFRVTYPVKPTGLQRQLYGDSLLPHVGIELCGKPLYQSLKDKPKLLVVRHARFLQLGEMIDCPTVYLERVGEALQVRPDATASSQNQPSTQQERLHSSSGRFQPLSATFPSTYGAEDISKTRAELERFFRGVDLLEPFSRIEVALKALGEQDEKFR
jgi:hypothetical protein